MLDIHSSPAWFKTCFLRLQRLGCLRFFYLPSVLAFLQSQLSQGFTFSISASSPGDAPILEFRAPSLLGFGSPVVELIELQLFLPLQTKQSIGTSDTGASLAQRSRDDLAVSCNLPTSRMRIQNIEQTTNVIHVVGERVTLVTLQVADTERSLKAGEGSASMCYSDLVLSISAGSLSDVGGMPIDNPDFVQPVQSAAPLSTAIQLELLPTAPPSACSC